MNPHQTKTPPETVNHKKQGKLRSFGFGILCLLFGTNLHAADTESRLQTFRHTASDGIERPYILYTPPQHGDGQPRALIVHLHGAISTPTVRANPEASVRRSSVLRFADSGCCYILFPFGQKDAGWFDPTGTEMVMDQIDRISRDFPIDPDKIFLSGFSDGASGTFYMASTRPERFAGFIALNGSLPVAAHLGTEPLYPANTNHKPFYIINTVKDLLYPAAMMRPVITELSRYNRNITFKEAEGNHDMGYLNSEMPALSAFIAANRRQPAREISWEGRAGSGTEWVRIVRLNPNAAAAPWHRPYRLRLRNDKAEFGMRFDSGYRQGLKVAGFSRNSSAEKMGVRTGDIILKMGETAMDHPYAPYIYLGGKRAGDPAELTVLRNGQEILLQGKFNESYEYEVFEKPQNSGKIHARLEGNRLIIDTSRVAVIGIDFDKLGFEGNRLTLVLNGRNQPVNAAGIQEFTVSQ